MESQRAGAVSEKRISGVRLVCLAMLGALAVSAALAAPAHALKAYAVTGANTIITFDTATPGTAAAVPLTIPPGESIMSIDYRPTTGEFFAITVPTGSAPGAIVRTYRIDIAGMTLVGQTQSGLPAADDVPTGYDFNPVTDLATYVNGSDENARLRNDGTIFSDDANLAPSTNIVAAAYDRNVDGASATTLYAIDDTSDSLGTIGGVDGTPAPDSGAFTSVGPLGFLFDNDSGFDIASNGSAFAAITTGADAELYSVNLTTGQGTLVADIGMAAGVRAFAIVAPSPPTKTPPVEPPSAQPGPDTAPDTTITSQPKAKTKKKQATFEFTGTDARVVASFECSLNGAPFTSCTSPLTVKGKKGKNSFAVRAKDAAGNIDPTPATFDWKVKKKKR